MSELLTAEQMAKKIGLSVKTFYKRVRKYSIPFIDARQPLFEETEVYRCLKTTIVDKPQTQAPPRRDLVLPNQKYRKLLGLEK